MFRCGTGIWRLSAAALGLALTGCGVPAPVDRSPATRARVDAPVPAGRALLFVHVPASMPSLKATVSIDGREVAQLPAGAFTRVSLTQGDHRIGLSYPAVLGPRCEDYFLRAAAGTTYHLRLTRGETVHTAPTSITSEFLSKSAHFVPVGAATGWDMTHHESFSPAH